jgi:hypothetical protein
MTRPLYRSLLLVAALAGVAVVIAALAGCSKKSSLVTAPDTGTELATYNLRATPAEVAAAIQVQESSTPELMRNAGIVGTAITADEAGRPAIMVLTETAEQAAGLPSTLGGYRVVAEVSGKIVAYGGQGGTGHTAKQTPPIQLGTSGGNVNDIANGFCCSGTLGSLVQKGGVQYILSNSHVFAGDVVAGGNGRVAQVGDDVDQPGLVDASCNPATTNIVADVSTLSTLYPPGSTPNVDCSIAQIRSGMVRTDGAILEIGTLSATTQAATVGLAVKKSGRTTGLSRSTISGLNATISVGYETECAGTAFTKTFTGQIVIANRRSRFLNSGDSGSLMVTDVATNPKAVGLLYAGSSTTAVANPIGAVLSFLGATMVGQ